MNKIENDENNRAVLNMPWVLKRNWKQVMIIVSGMEMEIDDFKNEGIARQIIKAYQCAKFMESDKFDTVMGSLSCEGIRCGQRNAFLSGIEEKDLAFAVRVTAESVVYVNIGSKDIRSGNWLGLHVNLPGMIGTSSVFRKKHCLSLRVKDRFDDNICWFINLILFLSVFLMLLCTRAEPPLLSAPLRRVKC